MFATIPLIYPPGATNVTVPVRAFLHDGFYLMTTPLTGVVGSNIDKLGYVRDGQAEVMAIGPSVLLNPQTSHTAWGFVEIAKGWYRIDLPDAALAAGASMVSLIITMKTGAGQPDGNFVPVDIILDEQLALVRKLVGNARDYNAVTARKRIFDDDQSTVLQEYSITTPQSGIAKETIVTV